jgi:hypothetical protein
MSLKPGSGTAQNFDNKTVPYTVTGSNGDTKTYTVRVQPIKSATKDITSFNFPGISTETIIGGQPDSNGDYPLVVWVPPGTDTSSLTPVITHTGINIDPASGTQVNFSNPVEYTVWAEDGSYKTYKVEIRTLDNTSKEITSFIFNEVPISGGTVRVVGAINQGSHEITAVVPPSSDISALIPTLTYIGNSIAGPGGNYQTVNPFTDTARNFSGGQTYTVKAQNNDTQAYTVKVIREEAVNVGFIGETEGQVINSHSFDQSTGILTVTINNDISPPYEWYVDGIKQAVSSTEKEFTLNAGDGSFTPGTHEIMVSGKKNGLHYTGKLSFAVSN